MPSRERVISFSRAFVWWVLTFVAIINLTFFRLLSWLLALAFVILGFASCVSDLSAWPAAFCFAALLGQYVFLEFYPWKELERRIGQRK